ncbi:hypothetical protein MBLNU230_g2717t1 [Neophaeotheca triangularis]
MEADPDVERINIYLSWTLTILYWICWPVGKLLFYLAIVVLTILKLLYRPIAFLSLPLLYLGRFVLACLNAPFQLLAKFETLYIYLGVAALCGLCGGLIVSYMYSMLDNALGLRSEQLVERKPTGRTAKQYRQAKRKEKVKQEPAMLSPGSLSLSDGFGSGRSHGLLNQTIMEEMDSDF